MFLLFFFFSFAPKPHFFLNCQFLLPFFSEILSNTIRWCNLLKRAVPNPYNPTIPQQPRVAHKKARAHKQNETPKFTRVLPSKLFKQQFPRFVNKKRVRYPKTHTLLTTPHGAFQAPNASSILGGVPCFKPVVWGTYFRFINACSPQEDLHSN